MARGLLGFVVILLFNSTFAFAQTFMSYNVKGDQTSEAKIEGLTKVFESVNPDVVAVQEVYAAKNMMSRVAEKLKMQYNFFAVENKGVAGDYGIAILSKSAPLKITTKKFITTDTGNQLEDNYRGLLIAEFADYYFICTHMGLNADDRTNMARAIIDFAKSADKAVFVGGDFNETITGTAVNKLIGNGFLTLTDPAKNTFGTKCIDMVLGYNRNIGEMIQFSYSNAGSVDFTALGMSASVLSDHVPVFTKIYVHDDQKGNLIESDIEVQ